MLATWQMCDSALPVTECENHIQKPPPVQCPRLRIRGSMHIHELTLNFPACIRGDYIVIPCDGEISIPTKGYFQISGWAFATFTDKHQLRVTVLLTSSRIIIMFDLASRPAFRFHISWFFDNSAIGRDEKS